MGRKGAFGASAVAHASALAGALFWGGHAGTRPPSTGATAAVSLDHIVWIQSADGGGGGGGNSGNGQSVAARRLERPGHDPSRTNVLVATPHRIESQQLPADVPAPVVPQLQIPALAQASALSALPGAVDAPDGKALSRGPGNASGVGTGLGRGEGPGTGDGLGDGLNGGVGGRVYGPGSKVTSPIEISHGMPRYTADAMRARIQGTVLLECVVQTTGRCENVRIIRSLDSQFGLDAEAVQSARLWRFKPGTRMGRAVPVLVTMEILFTLR